MTLCHCYLYLDQFEFFHRWSQTEVVVTVQLLSDSGLRVRGEVDDVGQYVRVCQLGREVRDILLMDQTTEQDVVPAGQNLNTVPGDVGVDLTSRQEDRLPWLQPVDVEQEGSKAARVSWEIPDELREVAETKYSQICPGT